MTAANQEPITDAQYKAIRAEARAKGLSYAQVSEMAQTATGELLHKLNRKQAAQLLSLIQKMGGTQ